MSDTPKHSVSVAGIVVDDQDRILVIQRRDNAHWEPPGGVLELDEAPEQGVRREVLEETGVVVDVLNLSGVYKNMKAGVVSLVFRCTPAGGHPRASSESQAVQWKTRAEVASLMAEAYSIRVDDAFDSRVQLRIHDGVRVTEISY